jgi:hypothetical protein
VNYCILSINDDRKAYKDRIRATVGLPEVSIPTFNAHENDPMAELERRGLRVTQGWRPKIGELGIWLSTINVWQHCIDTGDTVVLFEDDAIPDPNFNGIFAHLASLLPESYDFMAVWVPDNQRNDYYLDLKYDSTGAPRTGRGWIAEEYSVFRTEHPDLAKAYQGYGGVSLMFTPAGSEKFMRLVQEQGLWSTCDCYLFIAAHAGWVDGYAPHPNTMMPVHYDWAAATTIQDTRKL